MEQLTWPADGDELTTEHFYAAIEQEIQRFEEQLRAWELRAQNSRISGTEEFEVVQSHVNDLNEHLAALRELSEHSPLSVE